MGSRVDSEISLPDRSVRGFTLIEILIAIAVLAILATLGGSMYRSGVRYSRVVKAIAEIKTISVDIDNYFDRYNEYPLTLDDIGREGKLDPWNRPYVYLNYDTQKGKNGMRKDKKLKPLNSDYDLFSSGSDRQWKAPLSSKVSRDDIVRANDGEFVGIADNF